MPAKANPVEQAAFVEEYKKLKKEIPEVEPMLFSDAVHPTMATKITCGWIRKGSGKTIETTASRTRMNIVGAIELAKMKVHKKDYKTVNSASMDDFFGFVRSQYPNSKKIHMFLDNGPLVRNQTYNHCCSVFTVSLYTFKVRRWIFCFVAFRRPFWPLNDESFSVVRHP
ncbi:hypothetical protein FACS189472_07640 [Alphaproteobacteria bacterium]|nr:hypothetical protein FACS189472_07640 [Alphaproteobacteria bacterium]